MVLFNSLLYNALIGALKDKVAFQNSGLVEGKDLYEAPALEWGQSQREGIFDGSQFENL